MYFLLDLSPLLLFWFLWTPLWPLKHPLITRSSCSYVDYHWSVRHYISGSSTGDCIPLVDLSHIIWPNCYNRGIIVGLYVVPHRSQHWPHWLIPRLTLRQWCWVEFHPVSLSEGWGLGGSMFIHVAMSAHELLVYQGHFRIAPHSIIARLMHKTWYNDGLSIRPVKQTSVKFEKKITFGKTHFKMPSAKRRP